MINNIEFKNFKGASASYALHPVTGIYGNNFTGKSRIIEALSLACIGRVPGYSKDSRDIFDAFASGNPMTVEVRNARDGSKIVRQWEEIKSRVKCTEPDTSFLPVAFDFSEYIRLSGKAKTKFLFDRATVTKTVEQLAESVVANLKNIKLEENTPDSEQIINQLCEDVRDHPGGDSQEWVVALLVSIEAKLKDANQRAKRMESTVQGQTQIAVQHQVAPDAEAKLANARQELARLNKQEAESAEVGKRLVYDHAFATHKACRIIDVQMIGREIELLIQQKADLEKVPAVEPFKDRRRASTPEIDKELARLSAAKQKLFADMSSRPSGKAEIMALDEAIVKLSEAKADFVKAQADYERSAMALKSFEESPVCSCCGQTLPQQLHAERIKSLNTEVHQAHDRLTHANSALGIAASNKEKASTVYDAIAQEQQRSDQKAEKFRAISGDHAQLQAKVDELTNDDWSRRNSDYTTAVKQIADLDKKISDFRRQIDENEGAQKAKADLPGLTSRLEAARELHKSIIAQRKTVEESVDLLEQNFKQLTVNRAEAAARSRAVAEAASTRVECAVLKQAKSLLAELQLSLVKQTVGPLIDEANQLCADLLGTELAYDDGEIKIRRGGRFIRCQRPLCSGAEQMLAGMALSVALAQGNPVRLAIIDEIGNLDSTRRRALVGHACKLVASGALDQAIIVGTDSIPHADERYGVIELR